MIIDNVIIPIDSHHFFAHHFHITGTIKGKPAAITIDTLINIMGIPKIYSSVIVIGKKSESSSHLTINLIFQIISPTIHARNTFIINILKTP